MTSTNVHKQKLAGFAFSFGDALLEIDKDCTATWALGGVQDIFAETEPSIIGKGLLDFISSADRAAVLNYLVLLRDSKRPNPIELNINGGDRDAVPVLLSGIFLEQMNDAYFLAFRKICPPKVTVEARGAWRKPDESGAFSQRVLALGQGQGKQDASLSIIQLAAFEEFQAKLGDNRSQDLEQEILSFLNSSAAAEGTVTNLGAGRYGVMHDATADLESLKAGVAQRTEGFDESGSGLEANTASLALSLLSEQPDSVEALAGVLRQLKNHPAESMKVFENANALEGLINQARDDYNMVKQRLSDKSFSLVFQPIVDLKSRSMHHLEVLTRLDGSGGSPFEFICAAENAGLIKDFDFLICEKVAAWKADAANERAGHDLAINLSALSVQDDAFVADLERLMASLGDLKQGLHFEITETGKIDDIEGTNAVLQALRGAGHKVYLDDFGVGQTSLHQLRKWDIDAVKIDGSYVRDALSDVSTRHILKAIAGLCNDLEIDCVAEMIETEETNRYLLKSGIKLGQGYLFGKPS